MSLMPDAI